MRASGEDGIESQEQAWLHRWKDRKANGYGQRRFSRGKHLGHCELDDNILDHECD